MSSCPPCRTEEEEDGRRTAGGRGVEAGGADRVEKTSARGADLAQHRREQKEGKKVFLFSLAIHESLPFPVARFHTTSGLFSCLSTLDFPNLLPSCPGVLHVLSSFLLQFLS